MGRRHVRGAQARLQSLSSSVLHGGEFGQQYWRENLRYPLSRRLGGSQSQSGRFGEGKSLLLLPGFEPQISQPVA